MVRASATAANLNAMTTALVFAVLAFAYAAEPAQAHQCGAQAGGALCPNNLCCSKYGYCGRSCDHCGAGCQSQCVAAGGAHGAAPATKPPRCGAQAGGAACPDGLCCSRYGFCGLGVDHCGDGCQGKCARGVASVLTRDVFERMLPHRDDAACPARGFYTYDAFAAAARAFPAFAATGDATARKREVAAFLAQTSHETSVSKLEPDKKSLKFYKSETLYYFSNYNYGAAGQAIGADLLSNPDMVTADPVVAFKTALWLWMTPRSPTEPSCHAVATGQWAPAEADRVAGRKVGYGLTTSILTSGLQCGTTSGRVAFYKRYCDVTGVSYGPNLDCAGQAPFDGIIVLSAAHPLVVLLLGSFGWRLTMSILTGGLQCGATSGGCVAFYKQYCGVLGISYGPNLDCVGQAPLNGVIMSSSAQ
ncbi:hypothetical protein HU200_008191 [Digitaria exilis]|uniref:chitinase n=1 Tax=Digitaria exilis TaxID=1010633 RepID=A0A835KQB0_9POAL|nr:hypothetical protein HU200_008191 [Digitaria exilis]